MEKRKHAEEERIGEQVNGNYLKKENQDKVENYRGRSLLCIAYKVYAESEGSRRKWRKEDIARKSRWIQEWRRNN